MGNNTSVIAHLRLCATLALTGQFTSLSPSLVSPSLSINGHLPGTMTGGQGFGEGGGGRKEREKRGTR